MIKIEFVTGWLQEKLNEISKLLEYEYDFRLVAEMGTDYGDGKIVGRVTSIPGNMGNVEGITDIEHKYNCEIHVPTFSSNRGPLNVKNIIDELGKKYNGFESNVENGKGVFKFNTSQATIVKDNRNNVEGMNVKFDFNVKYTENVVTSKQKHWFLNGIEIKYESESVLVDKDGITKKINGENYSKIQMLGQTKSYRFTFPFSTDDELCVMLQRDILNGEFDKKYELKYYDGKAFTEDEPFISQVLIYKNAETSAQATQTSKFNITFTDADNGRGKVRYYLGLCDTVFDSNSPNARYFEPTGAKTAKQVQEDYWNDKIAHGCLYEQIESPNLNSIDITNQVYKNTRNYELFDLANKNYAVIKIEQEGRLTKYFYYFVSNISIGANNQVMFDLKLDSIQTYYFEPEIKFSDCLIDRAHLNRWIDNGDDTVSFDGRLDSKLFERENIQNVAKRLSKRHKVSLYNFQNVEKTTQDYFLHRPEDFKEVPNDELSNWLSNNVLAWVYVFMDPYYDNFTFSTYKNEEKADGMSGDISPGYTTNRAFNNNDEGTFISCAMSEVAKLDTKYRILCAPIMRDERKLIFCGAMDSSNNFCLRQIVLDFESLNYFLTKAQQIQNEKAESIGYAAYCHAIKISLQHPFNLDKGLKYGFSKYYNKIKSDKEHLFIFGEEYSEDKYESDFCYPFLNTRVYAARHEDNWNDGLNFMGTYGFVSIDKQASCLTSSKVDLATPLKFTKDEIIQSKKSTKFNPKLLNYDYSTLKLCDHTGDGFEYDIQKLLQNLEINNNQIEVIYTEPLSPDLTKSYARINLENGSDNCVYIPETNHNFTGFVGSNDMSLALISTEFQQTLANNKNYFQQQSNDRTASLLTGLFGTAMSLIIGNYMGAISTGASAIGGAFASLKAQNLTVDNMKNSPANIQAAKGNSLLNLMTYDIGIYIEEYDILPSEKESINNYMCQFGFSCNFIGNIKNYDNIRQYYNFIQAEIDAINGVAMSNTAREDIKLRFAQGIRFWNSDDISYEMENYERWLAQ